MRQVLRHFDFDTDGNLDFEEQYIASTACRYFAGHGRNFHIGNSLYNLKLLLTMFKGMDEHLTKWEGKQMIHLINAFDTDQNGILDVREQTAFLNSMSSITNNGKINGPDFTRLFFAIDKFSSEDKHMTQEQADGMITAIKNMKGAFLTDHVSP